MILYPDIYERNKLDRVLGKFIATKSRDPFKGEEIQPEMMEFSFPDFGFDNELLFMTDENITQISP